MTGREPRRRHFIGLDVCALYIEIVCDISDINILLVYEKGRCLSIYV